MRFRTNLATLSVATLFAVLAAGCDGVPPSKLPIDIVIEKEVSDLTVGLLAPGNPAKPLRLHERMEELGVTGLSIALVNEGELRWVRAFGEAPGGEDLDPTSPVAVGDLAQSLAAVLTIRLGDGATRDAAEESFARLLTTEVFEPIEMSHTRFDNGRLYSTAEDLTKIMTDLQKAHAGKPSRRITQEQARKLFGTAQDEDKPPADVGFHVDGSGQAIHFERRAATATHLVHLAGFVHSGHGAVVIVDHPDAGPLVDEILAGLAELYDWPAYRAFVVSDP